MAKRDTSWLFRNTRKERSYNVNEDSHGELHGTEVFNFYNKYTKQMLRDIKKKNLKEAIEKKKEGKDGG